MQRYTGLCEQATVGHPNGSIYYSETSLIQHSMGPENKVGLGGCQIKECLLHISTLIW